MKFDDKSLVLQKVATHLAEDNLQEAKELAVKEYPFVPFQTQKRSYTPKQSMEVFVRDGFIDRYSGERLVNPGSLRLLQTLMPEEFPAHSNWKMSETHVMYWELFPTIDHVDPIARGGVDDKSNWVCTSMLRNSAKSNWTLESIGWKLHKPGNIKDWDGLSHFLLNYLDSHTELLTSTYLKTWYRATQSIFTKLD